MIIVGHPTKIPTGPHCRFTCHRFTITVLDTLSENKTGVREVVAIKCVLKSTLNKRSTENLLTEIELLKKLKHEHIVELKDFLWDDKFIYLIMEYCIGGDLSHFLRKKRALPELVVRRFLQQIALAIHFLWSNNVAHMDLKPQNILLTSSENPILKIADFGFAKHMLEGTEMHSLRGSLLYMAPEILCKRKYDSRVDLWSIGVIFYECLFGQAPFASRSFTELEEKITDSWPIALPYGVEVSDNCRDLLLSLLKRDPDKRIKFTEFFCHPFIDLVHAPSSESLEKAAKCISTAVTEDKAGNVPTALEHYSDALEHFVAAVHYERDFTKKRALQAKVQTYFNRAEELKQTLKPKSSPNQKTLQRSTSCSAAETSSLKPLDELMILCTSEKDLLNSVQQLKQADNEVKSENYKAALSLYEGSLEVLLKMLKSEPKGKRKELLHQEAYKALDKAEEIKRYQSVPKLTQNDIPTLDEESEMTNFICSCQHGPSISVETDSQKR
ncbi:serine/threonine-protein kinase ULK3 isoform X2 [Octopus sinensis]|uniref:Serine/threonine-protein kinase ULK3 n=2 Tax=Octopus sinensis TaxID=2607531 RepID=A0A7E6FG72_9MOLL|nr:serine/threonine-protein kinase ULK3 isoform X2 [Octopus sinensis]